MKIAVLTIGNPRDKKAFSGILYKLYSGLQIKYGVENVYSIGPLSSFGVNKLLALLNLLLFKLFNSRYNYSHSFLISFIYSLTVERKLKNNNFDLVFAIGSTPSFAFIKNKSNIPIILFTDATFESLNNYYINNLCKFSVFESNYVERKAISKCVHIAFASKWARDETSCFYKLDYKYSSSIIKFGSNLENSFKRFQGNSKTEPYSLLFVGVDWQRKGGDILIAAFNVLRKKGYKVKLTIVGCIPPFKVDESIQVIPFLDKNNATDLSTLEGLYKKSHLFILPTRAECSAIVFSEASSFSLPIISTKTGGVDCYVEDGVTGFLMDLEDSGEMFADKIISLLDDKTLYMSLSKNSFTKYSNELNWDNSISSLDSIFSDFKNK